MSAPKNPALCHDWLNGMRGGEKCLEVFCRMFPTAPIYTLFYEEGKVAPSIASHPIQSSYLQCFPGIFKKYRYFLPFFTSAVESFDVSTHDLILSTSHCVAKGVRRRSPARHLCYCFTPVRYAWGFFDEYFGQKKGMVRKLIQFFLEKLRRWDKATVDRVDEFVAISHHVRKRIESFYGRPARVVYPPVDTDFYFQDPKVGVEDFYLIVSALVPYKRVDLAISAFKQNGKKLVVIGDGPERQRLETAASDNIRFLGWQSDEILRDYYRRCRALVFPGEEDFGIVPVEVQACGRFVIAYGKGGATETVLDGVTGVFFNALSAESMNEALSRFERLSLESSGARKNAEKFNQHRFQQEMESIIAEFMERKLN